MSDDGESTQYVSCTTGTAARSANDVAAPPRSGSDLQFSVGLPMYARAPETPFDEFFNFAKTAEHLGFEAVYSNDHFELPGDLIAGLSEDGDPTRPYFHDSWTALSAIAARTKSIRVGHQVTPLPLRHPAFIAKMGATIDSVSQGRFVLQVGIGWNGEEYRRYGVPFEDDIQTRYEKTVESIEIINLLWTQESPVYYHGKHYTIDGASCWPKPVQHPRPEMWMGGIGRKVRRLVAEKMDGWAPSVSQHAGLSGPMYAKYLTEIHDQAESFGRRREDVRAGLSVFVLVDETDGRALARAEGLRRRKAWSDLSAEEIRARRLVIIGDPDGCAEQLSEYVVAGVRYMTLLTSPVAGPVTTSAALDMLVEGVIPRLRHESAGRFT